MQPPCDSCSRTSSAPERRTAQALGVLDAHGSLHLVADAVEEDAALCLALTCRPLRDALFARFEPGRERYRVQGAPVNPLGLSLRAPRGL